MRDIFFLFYLVKSHLKRQFWILNCLFNLHLSTASIQVFAYTSLNTFHVYDYATANGIYEKECSVQRSVSYFQLFFYKLLSYIYSKASYVLWNFFLFVIMNSKARCEIHNCHFFLTKNVDLLHLLDSMWSESSGFSNYKVNHILNRISRSYFLLLTFIR